MIGQKLLKNKISKQIEENTFPRFSIIVGQRGSGKKLIAEYIAKSLNATAINIGTAVDKIRAMIYESYKIFAKVVYIISNADNMSNQAKNALLKVTEEPPNNAYFILTLQDDQQTLATIRSRGTIFRMDNYTVEELSEYATDKYDSENRNTLPIIRSVCETPGEVDVLEKLNAIEFYDYINLVIDNIAEVSGANAFKIGDKIAFKETDTSKYDLRLFWKAFMSRCSERLCDTNGLKYATGIKITSKYLQELNITGINKSATFDSWLLDIRSEWMEE